MDVLPVWVLVIWTVLVMALWGHAVWLYRKAQRDCRRALALLDEYTATRPAGHGGEGTEETG